MKKVLVFLLIFAVYSEAAKKKAKAQPASSIISGPSLPLTCSAVNGDIRSVFVSGTATPYYCDQNNHFTAFGSGGGGANANAFYLVSKALNAPINALNLGALSTGLLKLAVVGAVATPSTANAADIVGTFTGTPDGTKFLRDDGSLAAGTGGINYHGTPTASALLTVFDSTHAQTPCASCTLDSSGNLAVATVATGSSPPSLTPGTGGAFAIGEGTAPSAGLPASGVDGCYADSTAHSLKCSYNNGTAHNVPLVIASGTLSLGTTLVATGACSSEIDGGTATGVATTDTIIANANGDPTAVTGYTPATTGSLYIWLYPTADHVKAKLCNNTGSDITPGSAVTLNWRAIR